jgi:hypothetical protein
VRDMSLLRVWSFSMLWICDILVRIRIRIRRSVPLQIRILLFSLAAARQDAKKINLIKKLFASYFLKVHLHQSSKNKCQKDEKKNYRKLFLLVLLVDGRI